MQRIFARLFPNLPEKFLCEFSLQIFSHKDHKDLSLVWPSKQLSSRIFLQTLGPFFEGEQSLAPFLPGFSMIFPDFQGFCPDFQEFCPNFQGFCPDF